MVVTVARVADVPPALTARVTDPGCAPKDAVLDVPAIERAAVCYERAFKGAARRHGQLAEAVEQRQAASAEAAAASTTSTSRAKVR